MLQKDGKGKHSEYVLIISKRKSRVPKRRKRGKQTEALKMMRKIRLNDWKKNRKKELAWDGGKAQVALLPLTQLP